jgi:hypothetical protein
MHVSRPGQGCIVTVSILAVAYLQYLRTKAWSLVLSAPFVALLDPALGGVLVMFAVATALTGTYLRRAVS